MTSQRGDGTFRGRGRGFGDGERGFRGGFRGERGDRGFRGGRGRGGSNWEEARPLRDEELGSDVEIMEVTHEQMKFINEWQAYSRKNIKVLPDDKITQICIDFDFNADKI